METQIKLNSGKGNEVTIVSGANQVIVIPVEVYGELCEYIDYYKTEVSGCGMVEKISRIYEMNNYNKSKVHMIEYRITEVFLPSEQDNGGSKTDIDGMIIAKLAAKLLAEGKDTSKLKLHWHSHADMGVFHSVTDEENYADLNNRDFLVSLVLNKKKEVLGRVDYYSPMMVSFINLPVCIGVETPADVSEKVSGNIKLLDEFIASKSVKQIGFGTYDKRGSNSLVNSDDIARWRREWKVKKKLREKMKITDAQAIDFEHCELKDLRNCSSCKDSMLCTSYLVELAERLAGH